MTNVDTLPGRRPLPERCETHFAEPWHNPLAFESPEPEHTPMMVRHQLHEQSKAFGKPRAVIPRKEFRHPGERRLVIQPGSPMDFFHHRRTFAKSEISREEITSMMAGGEELETLSFELAEFARSDAVAGAALAEAAHEFEVEAEALEGSHDGQQQTQAGQTD